MSRFCPVEYGEKSMGTIALLYCFLYLTGTKTSRADMHSLGAFVGKDSGFLKIRHEHTFCPVIGMADIIACHTFFSTN